jgi:hypothetical protein
VLPEAKPELTFTDLWENRINRTQKLQKFEIFKKFNGFGKRFKIVEI